MNSKKAITLLLIATMIMGMIPVVSVNAIRIDGLADADGQYEDTIVVTGDDVTSGYDVKLYWDAVKAWNGEAGLLNTTEAENNGDWEIWFDVPEAVAGDHYLWIEDVKTGETEVSGVFEVLSISELSTSSGLEEDDITVDGYGFSGEVEVAVIMVDNAAAPTVTTETDEVGDTGDGAEDEFEFTLDNAPIWPGSVTIDDGVETFTDAAGDGDLVGDAGGTGSINYVTGEVELTFNAAPAAVNIECDYDWFKDVVDTTYLLEDEDMTDDLGSFSDGSEIPAEAEMGAGNYEILCLDANGNMDSPAFEIGPVISLDAEEGPTGLVIEIEGRGFQPSGLGGHDGYIPDDGITITDDDGNVLDCTILDMDDDPDGAGAAVDGIECDDDGEFDLQIVIPWVFVTGDAVIEVTDEAGNDAEADFEVTGLPALVASIAYGTQGAKVTVDGYNFTQIADEDVEFELWEDEFTKGLGVGAEYVEDIGGTAETENDGEFTATLTIPAVNNDNYQIVARQPDFGMYGNTSFRVTLMVVVLSSEEGRSGDLITMTGSGFTDGGDVNASIAGEEIVDITLGGGDTTFSEEWFVPSTEPGMYTLSIEDQDSEIVIELDFEVLENTYMTLDPATAPNEYNVTIYGYNFAADDDAGNNDLTFVLWNKTSDGEVDEDWDLDVFQGVAADAELNDEGNFTAWFEILDADDLSLGTYYVNCTDEEGLWAVLEFELVDETQAITPKKSAFRVGDVVAFDIATSFASDDSYIKIYDPSGTLYWETEPFDEATDDWITSGTTKVVPYYKQLADGQLMELPADAPLGTWEWTWYDVDDDELDSGTFTVEAAAADVIGEQVADLNNQITDLASQLTDVTAEFDDVKSDIADVAAIAEQAVTAAQQAAEAVQTVAQTANTASQAAADAATAAEAARDAANGLTTLVYGAIGAALVAALAAIVSLMQISRRIAG